VCVRKISSFIAEIKGNAVYGAGGETFGSSDVVWRQSFGGHYNSYRLLLIWDSGTSVDSDYWRARVREEKSLYPDPIRGYAIMTPASIYWGSWRGVSSE
jgi:hypothetical protein